jgi:hypothetical protein
MALRAFPVAEFHRELFSSLSGLGIEVKIHGSPNEVPDPIPFEEDREHNSYDAEYAGRWWRVLSQTSRVFNDFRAPFLGKCSPVHFFWGAFDLAVTRFSGRKAPQHPGGFPNMPDWITREAYSHEVSSCGFWPGGGPIPYPVFYSYAYPEPEDFSSAPVRPEPGRTGKDRRARPEDLSRLPGARLSGGALAGPRLVSRLHDHPFTLVFFIASLPS